VRLLQPLPHGREQQLVLHAARHRRVPTPIDADVRRHPDPWRAGEVIAASASTGTVDALRDEVEMLIVVLNDGETWTNVDGCLVLDVPDEVEDHDVKTLAAEPGSQLVAELVDVDGRLGVIFGT
jgi:hypothetical protein